MATVQGHCEPRFSALRDIFAQHLKSGEELGASIAVSIEGRSVVDLWGGYSDRERTSPWTSETIVPVWSTSKTITALATLLLIDRGQLDPNAPVSKYWAEFNSDDKKDILVRHLLAHTAGLPSWDPAITTEEILNVPISTEKLLAQKPWWTPGTASGYHLISQGHLLGGLIQRVSGKPLHQFVKEELALPRNADFIFNVPESEWPRIATLIPPKVPPQSDDAPRPSPDSILIRALLGGPIQAEDAARPEFRRSGIGSMGGFSNARAVNRLLSIITLRGEIDGKRFLSPETVDLIFQEQANGVDLVLGIPVRMGMGFGISSAHTPPPALEWLPAGKVCWWGGWGGSIAIMDLERKITFTYTMNRMEFGTLGNGRTPDYVKAVYAALQRTSNL